MRASDLARGFSGPAGLDTQREGSERERNEWPCPSCGRLSVADEELLDPLDPNLRRLAVAAGLGLTAFGLLAVLGVLLVHQALALPLAELPGRPGVWPVVLAVAGGLGLACTCLQRRTP